MWLIPLQRINQDGWPWSSEPPTRTAATAWDPVETEIWGSKRGEPISLPTCPRLRRSCEINSPGKWKAAVSNEAHQVQEAEFPRCLPYTKSLWELASTGGGHSKLNPARILTQHPKQQPSVKGRADREERCGALGKKKIQEFGWYGTPDCICCPETFGL